MIRISQKKLQKKVKSSTSNKKKFLRKLKGLIPIKSYYSISCSWSEHDGLGIG